MQSTGTAQTCQIRSATPKQLELSLPKRPLSPKTLAPLIIPTSTAPLPCLAERESTGAETPGPDVPPKSARMLEFSPPIKKSASKQSLAAAMASSVPVPSIPSVIKQQSKQPTSAPPEQHPWSATLNFTPYAQRAQTPDTAPVFGHRRGASEGGSTIMDRGRPKKRPDGSSSKQMHSAAITESESEERKAFESLPQSFTPATANDSMSSDELKKLKKQAMGQAVRFGVLSSKDVDKLSRVSLSNPFILQLIANRAPRNCEFSMKDANTFARPSATYPQAAAISRIGSACSYAHHASLNSLANHC